MRYKKHDNEGLVLKYEVYCFQIIRVSDSIIWHKTLETVTENEKHQETKEISEASEMK